MTRPRVPRAYELYLRGNSHFYDAEGWTIARDLLVECVSEDPGFAPAWARLGRCYRLTAKVPVEDDRRSPRQPEACRAFVPEGVRIEPGSADCAPPVHRARNRPRARRGRHAAAGPADPSPAIRSRAVRRAGARLPLLRVAPRPRLPRTSGRGSSIRRLQRVSARPTGCWETTSARSRGSRDSSSVCRRPRSVAKQKRLRRHARQPQQSGIH